MVSRSKINFVIDALMFLDMMAIGGLGFLMKYVLVPGEKRWDIYHENVDLFFWGLDRHQWGTIHLILGYILLGLLVLHIVLHWNQILCMFRGLVRRKKIRVFLGWIFLPLSLLCLLFAFFVPIEVEPVEQGRGRRQSLQSDKSAGIGNTLQDIQHEEHERQRAADINVQGYMTLAEVASAFQIPIDTLKKELALPKSTPRGARLGQLRKRYNFVMSDVESIILKYQDR